MLSTSKHFCPDFFEGRVNVHLFSRSFDLMDKISLHNLHMNMEKQTESISFHFCSDSHKTSRTLSVCVRNQEW